MSAKGSGQMGLQQTKREPDKMRADGSNERLDVPAGPILHVGDVARHVVDLLDIPRFIAWWNDEKDTAGSGSFIIDWASFELALMDKDDVARKLGHARFLAHRRGYGPAFDAALRAEIKPAIHATAAVAVAQRAARWAGKIIRQRPATFDAPAPFTDCADWVLWCCNNLVGPQIYAPDGGDLVTEREVYELMGIALRGDKAAAIQFGWLTREHTDAAAPRRQDEPEYQISMPVNVRPGKKPRRGW